MPYHRKTKEQFVKEAVQVHGDKYDYSVHHGPHTPQQNWELQVCNIGEVEYVNTHKLVRIHHTGSITRESVPV
jgi:hypothetical protein